MQDGLKTKGQRLSDTIIVTIKNYENFKGRTDVKLNSWFRLSNRFLEDSDFFDFTSDEKLCWIYILSLASQKNTGTITVNFRHAEKICGLKKIILSSAIEKLNKISCLSVDVTQTLRGRNADVTDTCATLQTDRQDNTNTPTEIDFVNAYNLFKRKEGKAKGLEKLKREVKTISDLELFKKAILNYNAQQIKLRTDIKYYKHFDSFVSAWREWVDFKTEDPKPTSSQKAEVFKHVDNFEYNTNALSETITERPELKEIVASLTKNKTLQK